jgi:hypothetical protein
VNVGYLLDEPATTGGAYLICSDRRVVVRNRQEEGPESSALRADGSVPTDLHSALRALDYYSGTVGYDELHLSDNDVAVLRDMVGDRVVFLPAAGIVEDLRASEGN